jgi:hypothetical protein
VRKRPNRFSFVSLQAPRSKHLELNTGKRGFVLARAYSLKVPVRTVALGNGLQLLSRVVHSVLNALQDSRERQARRIIEDYRRRCSK